jgi:endonuclease-8
VPEGHSIRHFANVHYQFLGNTAVRASSPQGRFSDEAERINGLTFGKPTTHGKHLFFHFDDQIVHVHLGLYGWFTVTKRPQDTDKDTIRLKLENDVCTSRLTAPTKCELITQDKMESIISRLGPDPLLDDSDPRFAWDKIHTSKKTIASLLMNQSVIAGIGNVYRAEILHRCQVNPYLLGNELSYDKFMEIWDDARYLLRIGSVSGRIRTVPNDFLTEKEREVGGHAQFTYVYKRTEQPCRVCRTIVAQAEVDGRTLYWCQTCQK